jgi:hypothetical protein
VCFSFLYKNENLAQIWDILLISKSLFKSQYFERVWITFPFSKVLASHLNFALLLEWPILTKEFLSSK